MISLLYVTKICPLSQPDIRSLDFAVFRFLMKLFKTNNKDSMKNCDVASQSLFQRIAVVICQTLITTNL